MLGYRGNHPWGCGHRGGGLALIVGNVLSGMTRDDVVKVLVLVL